MQDQNEFAALVEDLQELAAQGIAAAQELLRELLVMVTTAHESEIGDHILYKKKTKPQRRRAKHKAENEKKEQNEKPKKPKCPMPQRIG